MQSEIFYRAVKQRDKFFDGKFFFGVKTTKIYCRPICPARPKVENIVFFLKAKDAQTAGYRACLRCRPDAAPGSAAWRGKSASVGRAMKLIANENLNSEQISEKLGISSRHLRRLLKEEVGISFTKIESEIRLKRAHKLILESSLSITEIAYTSGYLSIRRFNDSFKKHFKFSPTQIRKKSLNASR